MEAVTKYEIKEIQWPQSTFLTKRATIGFDHLSGFFGEAYGMLFPAVMQAGIQVTEPPFAIYYTIDESKKETNLAAAIRIPGEIKTPEGLELVTIPAARVLSLTYYGPYENMVGAYAALEQYAAAHGMKREWMLEQYFSDPKVEKDPNKWMTMVYWVVS